MLQEFETSDISNENVNYNDIFGANTKKQKELSVLFLQLLEIKEKLMEEPGTLDPCTCDSDCLCNRDAILTPVSIVSGNL